MKTDVLIIGAGVYGIGLANYLHHQNRSFTVVGKFMDLWRNHTFENMKLRSDFSTSEVAHPENRYSADRFFSKYPELLRYRNTHLPVAVYRKYLDWIESNLEFPILNGRIDRLDIMSDTENGRNFCAYQKKDGSKKFIYSNKVVIATGLGSHIFIPQELHQNPGQIIHSYETRKIERLTKQNILVVGGGQSAAECIDRLTKPGNTVTWHARHSPIYLEQPVNISRWIFHAIVKSARLFPDIPGWLRRPLLKILSRPTIMPEYKSLLEKTKRVQFKSYGSLLASSNPMYDVIISATGYKFNMENFNFLSKGIKTLIRVEHSLPVLDKTFQSTIPGLYFTGGISESYFGTALKFIIGSHYSAKTIAGVLQD